MFRNSNSNQTDANRIRRSYACLQSGLKSTFGINSPEREVSHLVKVHSCVIDGKDAIVYPRNFQATFPEAFEGLKRYASKNNIFIKENARVASKKVSDDRRKNSVVTQTLLIISGMLCTNFVTAAQSSSVVNAIPEVTVTAKKQGTSTRPYTLRAGKRFITQPFGKREQILQVADKVKALGTARRVSTRGMNMPQDYVPKSVTRYDHTIDLEKGAMKFSYYEGEGFSALGYHYDGKVILDVLDGGGPFSAPELWGPYDQVIGGKRKPKMKMLMGDAKKDGMGLLSSGYAIGMVPEMSKWKLSALGTVYSDAVDAGYEKMIIASAESEISKDPVALLSQLSTNISNGTTGSSSLGTSGTLALQ